MSEACCAPSSGRRGETRTAATGRGGNLPATLVDVSGGVFVMGDESEWAYPGDGEGPAHEVAIDAFRVDRYVVSNERFAEFVAATDYVTDAQRYGWSFVFGGLLPPDFPDTRGVVAEWWRQVEGADWCHPEGPRTASLDGRADHPVVHVSWTDAQAFCAWVERRGSRPRPSGSTPRGGGNDDALPMGRRAGTGRGAPHERLPGPFPGREHRG